ncbi:hypothetical protein [Paracoccus sp. (in: a-proteobacteria)]|uniref:hypothetical protein n=1 Tax=Paracoccus sp. TaxID=267 RepID=UPI002D7F0E6D|nr:hypothetical protein [Paracoccus sp. (in: a-proteobacteria)]
MEFLISDFATAFLLSEVATYPGISEHLTYQICGLSALVLTGKEGEVRNVVFSRRVLDGLLRRVSAPLPLDLWVKSDFGSVTERARRFGGNSLNLDSMQGRNPAWRAAGKLPLNSRRIRRSEFQGFRSP